MEIKTIPRTATVDFGIDERFIPPDIKTMLDRWTEYRDGGGPWSLAGYMAAMLRAIDQAKPNGYDGQSAFDEFVEWIGGARAFGIYFSDIGKPVPRPTEPRA